MAKEYHNHLRETYEDFLERSEKNFVEGATTVLEIAKGEMQKIELFEEEFTHDILSDLFEDKEGFNLEIEFLKSENKYDVYDVLLKWQWDLVDKDAEILFKRNRTHVTTSEFYAEIESYMFSLFINILNL